MKTHQYHRELKENERVVHASFVNDKWANLLFTRREDGYWECIATDEALQDIQIMQAGEDLK